MNRESVAATRDPKNPTLVMYFSDFSVLFQLLNTVDH
jgi:hypothetical protein